MCRRLCHLEKELGELKIKIEDNAKIAALKDEIVELRTDLKICKKPDGTVFLQPNHLAAPYTAQPHAIAAHAPVVDVKRVRGDFDDPRDAYSGCTNGSTNG